jgi:DNA-binding protein HU-beta
MTKADLISQIASSAGLTRANAERAMTAALEGVQKALKKGDKVTLVGFGTFEVSKRAARTGRNPQTKAPIKIKASKTVRFKAGKATKDAVR